MSRFTESSLAMRFFAGLGLPRVAWALRRLHCPVPASALVLDVGSGGNPYPRANVLLDAYEETFERYHAGLVRDRPMVFGLAEKMPFKDKAFDFVIASHVLEHTADPDAFLKELMRVGKAGYIETPDAFFERINPFRFHRLEVTDHAGKLIIFKKSSWKPHEEWVTLYERKLKDKAFFKFLQVHPRPFYVRYYWSDKIDFQVMNPEVDAAWPFPQTVPTDHQGARIGIRKRIVQLMRHLYSQRGRNSALDIAPLLRCPSCGHAGLQRRHEGYDCPSCERQYQMRNGIPLLYPEGAQT